MSTEKHTPGPWSVHDARSHGVAGLLQIRSETPLWHVLAVMHHDHVENRANAALMAAAPDLLAACEKTYLGLLRLSPGARLSIQAELCALRDAIAAAVGESPQGTQEKWEERAAVARTEGEGK